MTDRPSNILKVRASTDRIHALVMRFFDANVENPLLPAFGLGCGLGDVLAVNDVTSGIRNMSGRIASMESSARFRIRADRKRLAKPVAIRKRVKTPGRKRRV